MKKSRGNFAVIAAAAVAAIAAQTHAANVVWNDTDPPASNWSDPSNWTGGAGVPAPADDVTFGSTGAAGDAATVTNVVDSSLSINTLSYRQTSSAGQFHHTQIPADVTLTLTSDGDALYVGTGEGASNLTSVFTTISGGGTLSVVDDGGTIHVRQGMTTNNAGNAALRATLDMSALANFTTNIDELEVGEGSSSSSQVNRAAGTLLLAQNSDITTGDVTVGFQSASGGNQSQLLLGNTTTLNTGLLELGIRKGNGMMAFQSAVTDGTLVLRGQDGSGRTNVSVALGQIGENTGSGASGFIDLTADGAANPARGGGTIDALIGTLALGRGSGGGANNTGRLTYDRGIVDANTVILGDTGGGTGSGRGILEVKGTAQLKVAGNVSLGTTANDQGTLTIQGTGTGAHATIGGDITTDGISTITVQNGSLAARRIGSVANPLDTFNVTDASLTVLFDPAAASVNVGTLTAGGTNPISFTASGSVTPGTYPVIDYGALTGGFTLGKLPARMVASLSDSTSTIDLVVTSFDSPKWVGNIDNNWNLATQNWKLINADTATAYEENLAVYSTADNVLFDDTAATGNVTVATNVAPGSIRFENTTARPYVFTGSGAIGGGTPITKNGDGAVTIANTGGNTIGVITINAGSLRIGDNTTVGGGVGSYGAIANEATLELSPAAGDTLSLNGSISGAGVVNHTGAGTTTLAGSGSYTGVTNITAGTVVVTNSGSFGSTAAGSGAVIISGTGGIDLAGVGSANGVDFGTNKLFNIAGSGVAGSGVIRNTGTVPQQNAFEKITLTDDATINTGGRIDIRGTSGTKGLLDLANHTLTKTGAGQFSIVHTVVSDGNIDVQEGTLAIETTSEVAGGGTITYAPGTTAQFYQNSGLVNRQMVMNGTTVTDANQTQAVTIESPITMTADNTFNIMASTGFTFTTPITGAGGLTKTGAGTLIFSGVNTFTGKLAANQGKIELLNDQVGSSSLEATGTGTIELVNDGTYNRVISTGNVVITDTAKVDLKNNKLITTTPVGTFDGTAYSGLQGDVARAYNFGGWDQPGLTTSEELAGPNAGPLSGTTTIGVATGEQVLFLGPTDTGLFAGQTVTGASTIAMYTYAGDVNFDGLVDAADYGVIDNWVQFPGSDGYANGDLNYDGVIDAGDYGIIDNTIQLQGAPFPGVNGAFADASSSSAGLSGVTAVPEPTACGLALVAAAGLLGRRRRRRRDRDRSAH